jgi:hypothetical protein
MDHVKVLKRSWEILWRYRALWVFGVIVALCTVSTSPNLSNMVSWQEDGRDLEFRLQDMPWTREFHFEGPTPPDVWPQVATGILALILGLACVALIVTVARVIFLYVSQAALIRMVDEYEETGEKRGIRQGFRLGWSRTALRLFVIDLLTRLPSMALVLILTVLGLGLFLLVVATRGNVVVTLVSVIGGIGLAFLIILAAIVVNMGVSLLRQFFFRVCALEDLGVIESLRQGFYFVKRHFADAAIMWLIMVGFHIGWIIVIIPLALVLLIVASVVAGLPALTVGLLTSTVFSGAVPWLVALAVAVPIFILVMAAPLTFLNGWGEVFQANVWTLTYRELRALEVVSAGSGQLSGSDTPAA